MRVSIAVILSVFVLLCAAPAAFAADDDKDKSKPAAEQADSDKAAGEEKLPEGATEVPDDSAKAKSEDESKDKAKDEKVEDAKPQRPFVKPLKRPAVAGDKEETVSGNATGESKSGASLKDLVNDGFVIRTTVFIPAEAVTRQLGKVSGDAVVVTLQKQFSTAICYYSFKAYVGAGLTKIGSCTVHQ